MIIDFHTHIFPDKIAKRTIDYLAARGGIPPFSDGSIASLLAEMERGEVDLAVTLPVLTSPAQFESVNRFAEQVNLQFASEKRRLISFAGIHPQCEDIAGKMHALRERGFLGVKIHPDYQETFIDDPGYERILACARELDMIVLTHAGVDVGYRDKPVRCTPARVKALLGRVRHSKLVLAHYGANEMFSEVYDTLCGEDVYFDTAYMLRFIDEATFKAILAKHGEDRVLFASDSPWSSIERDVAIIKSFSLHETTERKILCENAKGLLGI